MSIFRLKRALVLLAVLTVAAPAAWSDPTVTAYQLVSKRISTRTTIDFTYRVQVFNSGPALIDVSGSVASSSAATKVLSGNVQFGDVAAGARKLSLGTITIRQNRTVPYDSSVLSWSFIAYPGDGVPPDPGPAGQLTLEGVDIDDDGVRDDLERYISISQPTSATTRGALQQTAAALQKTVAGRLSKDAARAVVPSIDAATECLLHVEPDDAEALLVALENRFMNTRERVQAYDEFNSQLDGGFFAQDANLEGATACDFDLNALSQ